ncbi:MAG: T9SS type A sorting domain-containing protein [bacterium]
MVCESKNVKSFLKKTLLAIVFGLIVMPVYASGPDTLWTRIYGGDEWDWGNCIQECSGTGGYIVTGGTWSFGVGKSDVYLVRTNSSGDSVWAKNYGWTDYEEGRCVQKCGGGYIIAGEIGSLSTDVLLLKVNEDGDSSWAVTFGGSQSEFGRSIQVCNDGSFIIAGYTNSFGAGKNDVYVIKANSFGDTIWTRTFGGAEDDYGYSIAKCADGNFVIAGSSRVTTYDDVYLIKISSSGDTVWTRTFGKSNNDCAYDVKQCGDGGFILTGYTKTGSEKVYLIKTNSTGDTLWTRIYGKTGDDRGYSVRECSDNGFVISGYTSTLGGTWEDVYVIKTNSTGDTLWTRTFGKNGDDRGNSIVQCSDNGYVVAGVGEYFTSGQTDMYIIRMGSVGIKEIDKSISNNYVLYQNYPNPFSDGTVIEYKVPNKSNVAIKVYSLAGKLIKTILNGEVAAGSHTVSLDKRDMKSGIYFYSLEVGNYKETRKLTVLK